MELKFTVQTKIQKPVAEVFEAVHNPKKLSGYFTSGGASGPLVEGQTVMWTFADSKEGVSASVPVKVQAVVKDSLIRFAWEASEGEYDVKANKYPKAGGYDTLVEMRFEALGPQETLVSISEQGWPDTVDGRSGSYANCGGWMHMAMCLKAFVEHGINLRAGSI